MHARKRLDSNRSACRAIEHPRGNFQPAACGTAVTATPDDIAARLLDHLVNVDNASGPRMEGVKYLPLFSPVGVASPRRTTACVRTRRWPTGHRKSSGPSILPLRLAPATVKTSTQDSTPEWMKEGAQLRINNGCTRRSPRPRISYDPFSRLSRSLSHQPVQYLQRACPAELAGLWSAATGPGQIKS